MINRNFLWKAPRSQVTSSCPLLPGKQERFLAFWRDSAANLGHKRLSWGLKRLSIQVRWLNACYPRTQETEFKDNLGYIMGLGQPWAAVTNSVSTRRGDSLGTVCRGTQHLRHCELWSPQTCHAPPTPAIWASGRFIFRDGGVKFLHSLILYKWAHNLRNSTHVHPPHSHILVIAVLWVRSSRLKAEGMRHLQTRGT